MQNFPLNLLTFPLWWYTVGAKLVFGRAKTELHYGLRQTGLLVFARHLREPLYGDYTRSGIIFSFILRIIILTFKLLVFALRFLVVSILFLLYLALLPALIIMIVSQLAPTK